MERDEERFYLRLAKKEGWETEKKSGRDAAGRPRGEKWVVHAGGRIFELAHPYGIHLSLYREAADPVSKYQSMKAVHDYLWPDLIYTWNSWDERRFQAHCEGYHHVILAGGASCAKSHCAARIACIFWLSDPTRNTCIIASTTLESLESRIWGYAAKFISSAALDIEAKILRAKPPKIVHPSSVDKIHGMFAVAIREGEDERILSTLIGRHPDKGLMVVLDESTDMNPAIAKALPNLEKGVESFQLWAIGNSRSTNDLHGALATPLAGWESVDPMRDSIWKTNHKNGVCLYFNPYDSPAICDPSPVKRAVLSKFLATTESIESDKVRYGENSDAFYRFVLGFWKRSNLDNTLVSEQFLTEQEVYQSAEWSGFHALEVVAGLDAAFQIGGRGCILRLGVLGQTIAGDIVIDFRREELLFRIDIGVVTDKSVELQLAQNVVELLRKYNCPVRNMAIDATGAGRGLGELIRLVSQEKDSPFRIVSVPRGSGFKQKKDDPSVIITTPTELWGKTKEFIQHRQVKGLDSQTIYQLVTRLLTLKNGKLVLESKDEYKTRMSVINPGNSHSPDESDAMVLCLHAAVLRFGFLVGQKRDVPQNMENEFFVQKLLAARGAVSAEGQAKSSVRLPVLVPNYSSPVENIPGPRFHGRG